ncbi:DUF6465 family protein [Butyrivibrio sp. NC3005]|uniref:DUF6465 family protein n=1 Tax=Butyrivibrio sp. NC3005 TaxID=1280685 RepID=UPI000420380A|nr:DUF6465 family protein [Butyrivibrio sp. NC3005]
MAGKKSPATAPAKKADDLQASVELQYAGKSISYDDMVESARQYWTKDLGHKIDELKSLELYVKPEEDRVYYVANGKEVGSSTL